MLKKLLFVSMTTLLVSSQVAFAFSPKETAKYFNGPTVSAVTASSADVSLTPAVLADIADEEKSGIYFEYYETHQMCIMIYPTPEACLPKKTQVGKTSATLTNLKPDTSYTVSYKRDNTIRCITTPCPGNEFESLSVEFKTSAAAVVTSTSTLKITKYLALGSRNADVYTLQNILIDGRYMKAPATGYFGMLTYKAVREFQRAHNIMAIGFVGPVTRAALNAILVSSDNIIGEIFEGTVTAYSTQCFVDAECSITVDGKKVVTTIGRKQGPLGQVTGIPDFGTIENNIGAHAKVYALKTDNGYTLYGNAAYYVNITPKVMAKLPAGSVGVGDGGALKNNVWVWQKTVMNDGSTVTPKLADKFTITFGADDRVSGTTDCNGFFGAYTRGSDGIINFSALGSTMMYCDGSQESVFMGAIQKTGRYTFDESGNLIFVLGGEMGKVFFVKK
jgi:heat shock protein HslJ